ncbi:Choline transporter-like protein 1 [Eufriesea mexicana]|uniref:Choline transporter-like protein 1 n=1 Tax=Eufriesea mexicana TaxID=516756 RepID=A0A310SN41_9HYME|nr:Choline transporter-like protein 1 [Eufriesea mexicana]
MKLLVSTRGPCWAVAGQDRHFASQPHGVELNHPCGLTVDGTSPSASMCPSPSRVRLRQRTAPSRSEDALIRGGHPGTRCMTRLTVTGNECRRRVLANGDLVSARTATCARPFLKNFRFNLFPEADGSPPRSTGPPGQDQEDSFGCFQGSSATMGCCCCADEPSSKVEPGTPEHGEMSSRHSDQVFVSDRSCTDILPLLVLIGVVVGFKVHAVFLSPVQGFLLSVAVEKGDIYRIINGYDNCANVCGRVTLHEIDPQFACKGADMTKNGYQLITVAPNGTKSRECVRSCTTDQVAILNRCIPKQIPETAISFLRKLGLDNFYDRGRQARSCNDSDCRAHPPVVCADWHPGRLRSTDPRVAPGASPARGPPEIPTHDEIDSGRNECRRRVVRMTYEAWSCRVHGKFILLSETRSKTDSSFQEASRDIGVAWKELVYLLLIALAISLGILIAFRYMVQWVVYIVLIGVILACVGGSAYLWLAWYAEKKAVEAGEIPEDDSSQQAYFIYAIILSTITVITLLIVLVMRKRIALVMQLFREAGKAVYAMPALLLQPIYTYLLIGFTVCAWVYCILWIESAGNIYMNKKNHIHFRKDAVLIASRWYNLFFFFVTCEFLLGCQHMVVACAVARWFFTRDKKRLSLAVTRGFGYLTRYHLGTIAFGALVIGIIRLIRAVISYVQNRLKNYNNDFVRMLLWCCHCCFWCFECALKYLTRNAYIETAIYGCNFCTGGRKAFQALSSNILRVVAINSVGDFVLFLGKVLVVTLTVVSGIYLIQKKEGLHYPWVPIALAGLFAFLVAHCFISIYEMIIDTIFLCFCEDCEKNDGINRPYFMSRGLMEFVENSKKALNYVDHHPSTAQL